MDVTMPLSTGSLGEDLVRGVASVLLIHAVVSPIPSIAGDIESYATWLIARRFSNLMGAYGVLEVTACICVGLAIIQSVSKWWGGVVLDVMSNLFVLVASFLLAEWLMSGTNTGSQGDSIILLASMLSMGRLLMVIVV